MTYLKDGVSDKDFIEETKKEFPTVSTILRQDMYSNILNDMIVEPQEQAIPGIVALVLLVGGVSVFSIVILKNNANRMNNEIYKCIGYGTGHLIGSMLCYTSILALVAVLIALPLCYVTYPKIMILCLSIFGMEKYPFTYEFGYMLVANGGVILLFIIATLLSSLSLRKVDVRNLIQE